MKWFGELADQVTAHPIFLIAFNLGLVILWLILGTDIANIFISIVTAEMVLIGAGAARTGQKAIQAKLDEVIHALDKARDDLIGLEQRPEKEIEELKV